MGKSGVNMSDVKPLPDFLSYGSHYIDEADRKAVDDVLRSDRLTCGDKVDEFEKALCVKANGQYAVCCSNGTTALHMASYALDIQAGDKVIVPTITFLATANAPHFCGADIIFADVDPETALLTPETFQQAIDNADGQIKAVFPVHIAGHVCDMERISKIARANNIAIIEDACHAFGSVYKDNPVGSCEYSDMTMFSFHPVKNIAMGEGGAILTNNQNYAERMQQFRSHGMIKNDDMAMWEYQMPEPGMNYRLTDIQCALGLSQLDKLDQFKNHRQTLRKKYAQCLQGHGDLIQLMPVADHSDACWHLAVALIDFSKLSIDRDELMRELADLNIGTQVHYIPVHTQPYYKNIKVFDLPNAMAYYDRALTLPLHMNMTQEHVEAVTSNLLEILQRFGLKDAA
jgi:UDP-4-amino-4,6-dideoxy-N-acetyl-beta-L-altrosamine transaminase